MKFHLLHIDLCTGQIFVAVHSYKVICISAKRTFEYLLHLVLDQDASAVSA